MTVGGRLFLDELRRAEREARVSHKVKELLKWVGGGILVILSQYVKELITWVFL